MSRPSLDLEIGAIPEGPFPTARNKWGAIAKFRDINQKRVKRNHKPIPVEEFLARTQISEADFYNAESHKEYIDIAMSLAKAGSVLWFKDQLDSMQRSAEKLRDAGEDKEYLKMALEIAGMLKFKDVDFGNMEDAEVKNSEEVIVEVLSLLNDDGVRMAYELTDGLVPQRIIPALIGASFKSKGKGKAISLTHADNIPQTGGEDRPDKPVDAIQEAGVGANVRQEVHLLHGSEQDGQV